MEDRKKGKVAKKAGGRSYIEWVVHGGEEDQ